MGSDKAKITNPKYENDDGSILSGRILVWTEIKSNSNWINKEKNDMATEDEKSIINIPDFIQPNYRSFNYVFSVKNHKLIFESENQLNEKFGHTRALKLFSELFAQEKLWRGAPEVSVTVLSVDDAISYILSIPKIRQFIIHLERPNADDLVDASRDVMNRLMGMHAKSEEIIYTRTSGQDSLKLDENTKNLAKIAAENGYVTATGKNNEDNTVKISTKEQPKKIKIKVDEVRGWFFSVISSLELF